MGRFTANTSDLSSSDSDSEDVFVPSKPSNSQRQRAHDEDASSSDSDSPEELPAPPTPPRKKRPTRSALVEDENGDIRFSHELDATLRDQPGSSSRADPAVPWPQQVGVDPQRMHVMQASLFRVPEEAAVIRAMHLSGPPPVILDKTILRKHSRGTDGDGLRGNSRERTAPTEPAYFQPARKYARVEVATSIISGHERSIVDAGLSLGRSFRVSWGPTGTLAHPGSLCGPFSSTQSVANSSVVSVTRIPVVSQKTPGTLDHISKLLQHHLSHSPIQLDENGIPFASPSPSLYFSSFVALFLPTDRSYDSSLFRLGHALFDKIDPRLGEDIPADIHTRVVSLRRKAAVSAWLEETVAPLVDADIKKSPSADNASVAFSLLTGNQVERACDTALDGRNYRLATLIAQASGGDFEFQADLRNQLQIWRDQRTDVHISDSVKKVYALLAGIVDRLEGSKGTGLEKCLDLSVYQGLDWKRIYGLHLWYFVPGEAPLSTVFQAYNDFWKSTPASAPPSPFHPPSLWKFPSAQPSSFLADGMYALLRLHADPACSLSHILHPLSFSSSPLDFCMPWHLYIILSRCMRVRDFADRSDPQLDPETEADDSDAMDDDVHVEGHSPSADLLASSYAFQLERLGMIQEAAFVLLHIEGSHGRKKAILDLLLRSAPKLNIWVTRGLVGSLKIPITWVNEAKATQALARGEIYEAYDLYLSAGSYNAAHDLAVLELAPDAINRQDLELLTSLLERFASRSVDGWHERGKKLLDYVRVVTRIPELRRTIENRADVPEGVRIELEELLKSVPMLMEKLPYVLPRSDPAHSAAVAEMMYHLMRLLRPSTYEPSLVQPIVIGGAAKLKHINVTAYEKFLNTIQVS